MIEITEDFREKVRKAARSVASGVNQVEADDVEQDIWVRLLEDKKYYLELCEVEDPFKALRRIGRQAAYKQSSAYEHYTGNYTYTPAEVRVLLDQHLVDVTLERVTEHVDLVEGLLLLRDENTTRFTVLVDKYVNNCEPNRKATQRAVDSLTANMNQVNKAARYSYEGPGSRKVISNSQAFAKRESQ